MIHSATIAFDGDQQPWKTASHIAKLSRPAATLMDRLLAMPIFRDINAAYAEILDYPLLDSWSVRVLWLHGVALLMLITLNAYARLPMSFPSPFGWHFISLTQGVIALVGGGVALLVPLLARSRVNNHFAWRILLCLSLATYSYLFIYISGGSLTMHFHMFLVMIFIAVYADWRLEWLLFGFWSIGNIIFDTLSSSWIYEYGHNNLSVPLQITFLLVMAYFATVVCKNHRRSIIALIDSKQRNDRFLAIASHELRTPLTSMKGYIEVLERRLKRSTQPELTVYTIKLDDQLSRMSGMIRDLLDVSKIQSGQLEIRRERLSINSVVEQSIEEVQALTNRHQILVSGWANTPVMGDPVRLCQVIVNLLSNAIKYSPTSDRVMIRVSETRDKVIVSVRDFGIGVPEEERASIFEPYFRSQHTQREDVPGGLGMGLYISQEIVRWHGGRIWLDDREEQGSTFSFILPSFRELPDKIALTDKGVIHA
jgi:signal transduction histidine kinase